MSKVACHYLSHQFGHCKIMLTLKMHVYVSTSVLKQYIEGCTMREISILTSSSRKVCFDLHTHAKSQIHFEFTSVHKRGRVFEMHSKWFLDILFNGNTPANIMCVLGNHVLPIFLHPQL